jgi:hypothetical protein
MRHFYIYQSGWAVIQMIDLRVIPDSKDRCEILYYTLILIQYCLRFQVFSRISPQDLDFKEVTH